MKRITSLFLTVAVSLLAGNVFAQDLTFGEIFNKATEAYQAGNGVEAVAGFRQALKLALAAEGEEGAADIAAQCKQNIPAILSGEASKSLQSKNYAEAEKLYNEVIEAAKEFSNDDVLASAKEKLMQIPMAQGADALNSKNYAGAVESFKKAISQKEDNAKAYLYLGMAQKALGSLEEAEGSLNKANELGEAGAKGQLSSMFMSKLAAAMKAKDYASAVTAAEKVNAVASNPQASMFGGMAAFNLKKYSKAIELFKEAPQNTNTFYYLAKSYEGAKNNAQACVYYKKITSDAKFGAYAKSKLTALSCK